MKIEIRASGVALGSERRQYVERRVQFALGRFAQEISGVTVRVEDVNGPRKGIDQRCTIRVVGPRLGTIFIEETDARLEHAVDRATERAGRTVARALSRQKSAFAPSLRYSFAKLVRSV